MLEGSAIPPTVIFIPTKLVPKGEVSFPVWIRVFATSLIKPMILSSRLRAAITFLVFRAYAQVPKQSAKPKGRPRLFGHLPAIEGRPTAHSQRQGRRSPPPQEIRAWFSRFRAIHLIYPFYPPILNSTFIASSPPLAATMIRTITPIFKIHPCIFLSSDS